LDKLIDVRFIHPSKALYGALVLFHKKVNDNLCMCVDYRALNKVIIKNKYSMPLIQNLMDKLYGVFVFTKLDLRFGYLQMRIDNRDEHKTTCVMRYGVYEFLVISFGLTNALQSFTI